MITRRGVGFIAAAVAVFFVAGATRVGWVHLADAVLWGVVILSFFTPWLSAPGIGVSRRISQPSSAGLPGPVEGEPVEIQLQLANRWWLPRFLISARYPVTSSGSMWTHRFLFAWVGGRRGRSNTMPVTFPRRGNYSLGRVTLEHTAPFGLFRRRVTVERADSLLVYPKWQPMARVGLLEAAAGDTDGGMKGRIGAEVASTRRYVVGDSFRHIHWRNSARSGALVVKEFDAWADRSVTVVIDTETVLGEGSDSAMEYAIRMTASASRAMIQQGSAVRVAAHGRVGEAHMEWPSLMAELAQIEPESHSIQHTGLRDVAAGTRVLAFVAPDSLSLLADLHSLARSRAGAGMAAVIFDGFTREGQPHLSAEAAAASLAAAGISVILCRRGALQQALADLEAGTPAQRHAHSVPSSRAFARAA